MNQGVLPIGESIGEQFVEIEVQSADLNLVLISHLGCDHVVD